MFEETLPSAASPGVDPVTGRPVACLDPCDLVDPELEAMLDRLAREYAAVPAAGVLLVDVDELPAGPELAGPLARLDVSSASAGDLVEATAGLERLEAWAAARKAAVLDELASRAEMRPDLSGYRSVNPVTNTAMVIAGRCHLTCRQAENQVGHALQLVEDFPDTHTALSSGAIDLRRARVITDELGGQDPAVRTRVEGAVLPEAPGLDSVALRKLIKRLLHELAPVEAAQRHEAARDGRYVAITPASDGMAHLEARLPAVDATALNTALNAAAADAKRADTAAGRPARTKDQRRADALAELGWTALTACADAATGDTATGDTAPAAPAAPAGAASAAAAANATGGGPTPGHPGTSRPRPPRPIAVHVTVPFATLAGLSDEPGELDGYGPIPAHVARALATEGVWTWLATDPGTREVLDHGRTRYRPTRALAHFITARDKTCRAPGCHRTARTADLDHIVPFDRGGTTSAGNLHALCETHHLLKHHGGWHVERQPDGTTHWTSPTGHRYRKPPGAVGPAPPPADGAGRESPQC